MLNGIGEVFTYRKQDTVNCGHGVYDPSKVFYAEDPDGKVIVDGSRSKIVKEPLPVDPTVVTIGGKDYHFVTDGEFLEKLLANEMVECAEFNHWFYGTLEQDLSTEGINIGTFTPIALEALATHPNIAIKLFYIDVPDRVRLLRQLSRDEDVDVNEVVRRYKTDQEDFADISDFIYTTLPNETEEDKKLNVVTIVDAAHKMLLGNLN